MMDLTNAGFLNSNDGAADIKVGTLDVYIH